MLLVEDQYVQNRKIFETDLRLRPEASRPVFSEHKDIWELGSGCEEEGATTGSEGEGEDRVLYADADPELPEEAVDSRRQAGRYRKKNVRFEGPDFNCFDSSETSSLENEYLEFGRRRSLSLEPDVGAKARPPCRAPKTKWRTVECDREKRFDRRPKSTPEPYLEDGACGRRPPGDGRRKDHRCARAHHGDFDLHDFPCGHGHKFECRDELAARHCDRYLPEEVRPRKTFVKMKPPNLPAHKHACHLDLEAKAHRKPRPDAHYDPFAYHPAEERYCQPDEYYDHVATKSKKKILEAVEEQQEQFSDSTYKVPCSKYSSHTIPGEFQGKRSLEKLTNESQSDWLYYSGKGSLGEVLHDPPPRIHKMRSRRTRMNRIRNGWKKAFVQTVRDGSRNERVGVIVMGSKGPEFYSKNSKNPPGPVPFRKSKSFLDGAAKSFEVMTVDCKNVFLSSSEPGPRTNYAINDLLCPEDDLKVEEKMAKFSKNVNDIVKSSESKFYRSLSNNEYGETKKATEGMLKGAGEGPQRVDWTHRERQDEGRPRSSREEKTAADVPKPKFPFQVSRFDPLSPRVPKSSRRPEKKFNQESKAIANALNEQARQYRESQANREEKFLEGLKELQEKFPPKEISPETAEANLALWGMSAAKAAEEREPADEGKKEEAGKDETSQTGSAKSTEQITMNKQRRKKYYEATTATKGAAKQEPGEQPPPEHLPSKRVSKVVQWPEAAEPKEAEAEADADRIPAIFRDLVENGRSISKGESENLRSILARGHFNPELCSNDLLSSSSSCDASCENKANASPRSSCFLEEGKDAPRPEASDKEAKGEEEAPHPEAANRKTLRMKTPFDEHEASASQTKPREGKPKKKAALENRMRLLREALPSIAAENEAAHLKQLKRYIDRFIDRVEASTTSECRKRKESRRRTCKDSASTDSSEVKVDARKILDFVSNPFKKISSDVTINIAKKLTDALVQEKSAAAKASKRASASTKARKTSECDTDQEGFAPCGASSGSEPCQDPQPTYLKQLKKMRNEHLNNIVLEVRRLSELLRFLDRCNRLVV